MPEPRQRAHLRVLQEFPPPRPGGRWLRVVCDIMDGRWFEERQEDGEWIITDPPGDEDDPLTGDQWMQ